jgi:hypothetical protein
MQNGDLRGARSAAPKTRQRSASLPVAWSGPLDRNQGRNPLTEESLMSIATGDSEEEYNFTTTDTDTDSRVEGPVGSYDPPSGQQHHVASVVAESGVASEASGLDPQGFSLFSWPTPQEEKKYLPPKRIGCRRTYPPVNVEQLSRSSNGSHNAAKGRERRIDCDIASEHEEIPARTGSAVSHGALSMEPPRRVRPRRETRPNSEPSCLRSLFTCALSFGSGPDAERPTSPVPTKVTRSIPKRPESRTTGVPTESRASSAYPPIAPAPGGAGWI